MKRKVLATISDVFENTVQIALKDNPTEDTVSFLSRIKRGRSTALLIVDKSSPKYEWLQRVVAGYAHLKDQTVHVHEMSNCIIYFVNRSLAFSSSKRFKKWMEDCKKSSSTFIV